MAWTLICALILHIILKHGSSTVGGQTTVTCSCKLSLSRIGNIQRTTCLELLMNEASALLQLRHWCNHHWLCRCVPYDWYTSMFRRSLRAPVNRYKIAKWLIRRSLRRGASVNRYIGVLASATLLVLVMGKGYAHIHGTRSTMQHETLSPMMLAEVLVDHPFNV